MNTLHSKIDQDNNVSANIPGELYSAEELTNSKLVNVLSKNESASYPQEIEEKKRGTLSYPQEVVKDLRLIHKLPQMNLQQRSKSNLGFLAIQRWEGVVQEVYEDSFTAILNDISNSGTKEFAEISKSDISLESDIDLLDKDAIFYMSIGYQYNRGQRIKGILIKFKRTPLLSERQKEMRLNRVLDKANELFDNMNWQ